ncbi:MAG: hypothetical protein AAF639_36375, partial [Chloroflexota bacterium]
DDKAEKKDLSAFLQDFIVTEDGCGRVPSDRYAISLIFPTLVLHSISKTDMARKFIQKSVVWLCDRYEDGFGLASVGTNPYQEIIKLFGYPFEHIPVQPSGGSLTASVVSDLAAFLNDQKFYSDVVNDVQASNIFPQYWQVADTIGLFKIEGTDVIRYPNIMYKDHLSEFEAYDFADHILHEQRSFRIAEMIDALSLMPLMLLLRDRYFPTLWPTISRIDGT